MSRNARFLLPALALLLSAAAVRPTLRSFGRANPEADDAASATRLLAAVRGVSEPVCQLVVQAVRNQQFGRSPVVMAIQGDEVPTDPAALWALSSMQTPGAVAVLSAGLRDADPCVRALSGRMLAKTHFASSYDALLAALGDQDSTVRAGAARSLGRQRDRRAPERLIATLHDPAATVRASAAEALGAFGRRRFGNFDFDFDMNFDVNVDVNVGPV
ncbi:MAG: HEAT repeat domain-containing protein, partial [Gemmatimonadales bacterium]